MKKLIILPVIFVLFTTYVHAQVGIGAGGGLYYPGVSESESYGSRFVTGAGYEFFARHQLLTFSPNFNIHARYAYQFYYSDINLPFTQETRFTFNFLIIAIFVPVLEWNGVHLITGGGLGLLTVQASKDLLSVTESLLVPQLKVGIEKSLGGYFNIYADLLLQFGSFPVRDDVLSINGLRLIGGFTMFLTD
jgi:hypothetical protein